MKEVTMYKDKCDGCTYMIIGVRKDRKGNEVKACECVCEAWMCAGCIPTYEFSEAELKE